MVLTKGQGGAFEATERRVSGQVASGGRANGDGDLAVRGTWGKGNPSNVTGD
jgi:hypothetical protein